MDLRQLRYFVGIVQAGSLSRAADQLRIAQSAISHHLASLESEVGKPLVTRGPRGIHLTEAGAVLYRHAEAILRHVEIAKVDTISAQNTPSGRVSVGLPVAWTALVGYELFARVRGAYPQILPYLTDGNGALLRERLLNGRLDLAVLFTGQAERGLNVEPLIEEELFYVTADPDPSPITVAEVAQRPLLLPGPGSGSQRVAQQIFNQHGLTVTPVGEIDTQNTLLRAIASGIGGSILPWCNIYDGERVLPLTCRRFADAKLIRPVALCFSDVGQRSPAIEAVALSLKSVVCELVESGLWKGASLAAAPSDVDHSLAPQ
ncbi:MAG TPA: LysR substrate-binding domain-containing protein [Xanthobacteraceae bacterium]|nr:LysR substrate-binding domain-containing protein [Xanthobacteraceae bacterium]